MQKRATSQKVLLTFNFVYTTCRTAPRNCRLLIPISANDRSLPVEVPSHYFGTRMRMWVGPDLLDICCHKTSPASTDLHGLCNQMEISFNLYLQISGPTLSPSLFFITDIATHVPCPCHHNCLKYHPALLMNNNEYRDKNLFKRCKKRNVCYISTSLHSVAEKQ